MNGVSEYQKNCVLAKTGVVCDIMVFGDSDHLPISSKIYNKRYN